MGRVPRTRGAVDMNICPPTQAGRHPYLRHRVDTDTLQWIVPGPQGRVAVYKSPLGAGDFNTPLGLLEGTCRIRRR
eukprot:8323495-Pyramimonas_sp.AAC.1